MKATRHYLQREYSHASSSSTIKTGVLGMCRAVSGALG